MLRLHEAVPAVFFHFVWHMAGQIARLCALDVFVPETTDTRQLGLLQPIQHELEISLGLAGEADNESGADREIGTHFAPAQNALQRLFLVCRTPHRLQHSGRGVLEGNVQIGQHFAFGHQRDDIINMRVRIDIVQPDPNAEFAQRARQIDELGFKRLTFPGTLSIFDIEAIGAGVL